MAYFNGTGVVGSLHPSLQAYIDCFKSSPFPKMYPRGGGPWDQDPMLMNDFREIRKIELHYRELESNKSSMMEGIDGTSTQGGGGADPEDLLTEYLEEMGYEEAF